MIMNSDEVISRDHWDQDLLTSRVPKATAFGAHHPDPNCCTPTGSWPLDPASLLWTLKVVGLCGSSPHGVHACCGDVPCPMALSPPTAACVGPVGFCGSRDWMSIL